MRVELSDIQIKSLTQILSKYYSGQQSIALEAQTIQELAKAIQTPAKECSDDKECSIEDIKNDKDNSEK